MSGKWAWQQLAVALCSLTQFHQMDTNTVRLTAGDTQDRVIPENTLPAYNYTYKYKVTLMRMINRRKKKCRKKVQNMHYVSWNAISETTGPLFRSIHPPLSLYPWPTPPSYCGGHKGPHVVL